MSRQPGQSRVIQGVIGHTPSADYQSGSSHPRKRRPKDGLTQPQRSKRAKYSDDSALQQSRSGLVDEQQMVARKRRRTPTCGEDATSTKRARPDAENDDVGVAPVRADNDPSTAPQNDMRNREPMSPLELNTKEVKLTMITGDRDRLRIDNEFDKTSVEDQNPTLATTDDPLDDDVVETTDPATPDSGEHVDSTEMPGSVEVLQRRLTGIKRNIERTVYASQTLETDPDKPPCPSGRLVGIGLWPRSNHIPGQAKVRDNEDGIIELPARRPRHLRKNSVVSIPASRPKHYLERKAVDMIQPPPLHKPQEPKPGSNKTVSSHVRLVGIWDQSVGNPMGPKTWTE